MEQSVNYTPQCASQSYLLPESLPNLPLPPPLPKSASSSALPPLVPFSRSASHTHLGEDQPRIFSSPAPPSPEDPLALPPASEPIAPPWPVDLSALCWLLPPSAPPETISLQLHQAPSSLRLHPGRTSSCMHLRGSVWLCFSFGSAVVLGPTGSPQSSGSQAPFQTLVAMA
ncbi:hypothetical protein PO909_006608 [Leuciscus waleckii]